MKYFFRNLIAFSAVFLLISGERATAGDAVVLKVRVSAASSSGHRSFDVTVRHADEGWKHYANLIQVLLPDGTPLNNRVLAHPHVNEQPFERGARRVLVPKGVSEVLVRARDSVHGHSHPIRVPLPADGSATTVTGKR